MIRSSLCGKISVMPSGWQLFASRKWDDKDCGSLGLTHVEVQVLLLVVNEFDFVLAILNEERIKRK